MSDPARARTTPPAASVPGSCRRPACDTDCLPPVPAPVPAAVRWGRTLRTVLAAVTTVLVVGAVALLPGRRRADRVAW